jgi:outer membrane protein OmpA-like peptidoglycan-associated protein
MPRSYATSKLKSPLKKGTKYCVSFYVSLAELSKYSSNNIGAILAKKSYSTDAKASIIEKTHVLHYDNKIFNAFYNWEKVCGMYTAEGGEKFIILGNFENNDATKNERNKQPKDIKGTPMIAAYYYIDEVSVSVLEDGKQCECGSTKDPDEGSSTIYQRPFILTENLTDKQKIEAQASFFAFGKTRLQPEALRSLDLIAESLKAVPQLKLQINGFVDSSEVARIESNPLFEGLDLKRAEAAFKYLVEKGIDESRITIQAMGYVEENELFLETDEPELKAAKRRRISFKILD